MNGLTPLIETSIDKDIYLNNRIRAMVSHFTYSVADLWCVADLSGIDKGTGTGIVRNAFDTLENSYVL
jgi:hypothetical protein